MPNQIQNAVKNERTARLIEESNRMSDEFIAKFVGRAMPVLYEREIEHNIYEGYTTNYIRVLSKSSENIKNKILNTEILSFEDEKAHGKIL